MKTISVRRWGQQSFPPKVLLLLMTVATVILNGNCNEPEKTAVTPPGERGKAPVSVNTEFLGDLNMTFCSLPPGTFLMGYKNENEIVPEAFAEIEKELSVTISDGLSMGRTEVTNRQFLRFVAETEYAGGDKGSRDFLKHLDDSTYSSLAGPEQPVVFVNWHDAQAFCHWVSVKLGRRCRLPSEQEWEYACRSGTLKKYGCADDDHELLEYGWLTPNSVGRTHVVGSRRCNAWGLYDMNGNVWEWVSTIVPAGLLEQSEFRGVQCAFIRGGGFCNSVAAARCGARWGFWPLTQRTRALGFRVVLDNCEPGRRGEM